MLAILPEELAIDVVERMLRLEAVQKEILEKIESTLRTEFMSTLSHTKRRDSHEEMAEIFNTFDRQTEARFITSLEENNREAAERIKALMFTFDDLIKLDSASASRRCCARSTRRSSASRSRAPTRRSSDFFFANMSARAGKMLKDDMDAMGPVRLKDVDEAQGCWSTCQGSGGQGRNHAHQEPRRRRAGVLMAAPAKFLFDVDLAAPDKGREKAPTPAEIAQKLADAEARAYRAGYDAAQREAKAESDRRAALAMEEISLSIRGIATRFSGIETRMETEAVDVAVAVARKLCTELVAASRSARSWR